MTVFIEGATATVAEIAKRAGMTPAEVQTEAASLGLYLGVDWSDQPALSTQDAYLLASGTARRNAEHETAFRDHTSALESWQVAREELRRRTLDEAWKASVREGWGNSPSMDIGHEAAREAVAEFEKTNPEPTFSEPDESRVKSWLRKVTAGAR